jgi:hypothetical protein
MKKRKKQSREDNRMVFSVLLYGREQGVKGGCKPPFFYGGGVN